jgi:hypothetical protein
MPYDPKRNLLYLHIPKCAGKSVEVALGLVSKSDVAKYRWRNPLNRIAKGLLRLTEDSLAKRRLFGTIDFTLNAQHLTLQEIILLQLIPLSSLKKATIVASVRHPEERAVSLFRHWLGDNFQDPEQFNTAFAEFLSQMEMESGGSHGKIALFRQQYDYIRSSIPEIQAGTLLRVESLAEDLKSFSAATKFQLSSLPQMGKEAITGKWLSPTNRESVRRLFPDDFRFLGYE